MSDKNHGKKFIEEELYYFLDAYQYVTGNEIGIISRSERPDFICETDNGQKLGIELTKILLYPESAHCIMVVQYKKYADPYKALGLIYSLTKEKNEKLKSGNWNLADNTVLVLQLMDWKIKELTTFLSEDYLRDFYRFSFTEIWMADYTGIEAYGNVELFCIKPQDMQGYYERPNPWQKPYA